MDSVNSVDFSPDRNVLASGSDDCSVKIWNLDGKCEEFILKGHTGFVITVAFSPDGKVLASGSFDKSIKIWNLYEKNEEF